MSLHLYFIPLLLLYTQPVLSMTTVFKRADPVFLAMVCQEECGDVHVRFLDTLPQPNENDTVWPFELIMHSANGSFFETKMEVPEDVSVLQFVYAPVEDENGTTTQETDIWDLNFSETYFHSSGSLQVVGNLPCGKYGCPQSPLCDGGCRFTVIVSLAAFCLSILAGLVLQTVYVSFLGFRKTRKQLELRDTLRLTESAEQSH